MRSRRRRKGAERHPQGRTRILKSLLVCVVENAEIFKKMCNRKTADSNKEIGRFFSGSPGRTRTSDRVVNSHLLYQLSYRGINF